MSLAFISLAPTNICRVDYMLSIIFEAIFHGTDAHVRVLQSVVIL